MGQGLQPVAAFNYGAKKYRRVRQAAIFTIFAAFCFVCVLNVVCWCNSETLIHLFRDDPEVLAVALPAFRYQCLAMFLQPRSFCVFLGCAAHCALLCSFWSMAVNSGGRGQWSSTGSPVRGWMKRRPVAWRHWPVRPGTGFLAP